MPPKSTTTTKPAKTKASKGNKAIKLLTELLFIESVYKKDGTPVQQHACFNNGRLTASNGVLSTGIRTDVDLIARPHIKQMLEAIRNCPAEFAITQVDAGKLCVKAGKFSATIPCLPEESPGYAPDAPVAAISDVLRVGFDAVAPYVKEDAKKVILGSILLRSGSMISTDAVTLLEFWHGLDLPQVLLPKGFISAVLDTKKPLMKMGFSDNSLTFFYDDESWIKTQLLNEQYPNTDGILNVNCNPEPLPKEFYKGLLAIEPFSKSGNVYFGDGLLQSHRDRNEGAVFEVPEIKFGPCFNIKQLRRIEPMIEVIDFYSHNYALFFGSCGLGKVRGALMGVSSHA